MMDQGKLTEAEIKVFGRVQGVAFRYNVRKHALSNGLRGYVLNRDDGSVFISVQGTRVEIELMIEWIKSGPGFSNVEKVDITWIEPRVRYEGFEIFRNNNYIVDKAKSIVNLGKTVLVDDKGDVPKHVLIIPDGNRRWARERGLAASFGHYTSASDERIVELITESKKMGIEYLSLWGFSTENWKRDEKEVKSIFDLVFKKTKKLSELCHKNEIRFRHIGRRDRIPKILLKELEKLEKNTRNFKKLNLQLMLDYGGRDEIIRAVNKLLKSKKKKVDEDDFKEYLDTKDIPDVDLIIRTSGEKRTSGAMPYQSTYAELYFADCYFPEFDVRELRKAIDDFSNRTRRFGATAKKDLEIKK
jgi:undecaprenyl diphosphate synthase